MEHDHETQIHSCGCADRVALFVVGGVLQESPERCSTTTVCFAPPTVSATKPSTIYTQWPFDATEAAHRQDETAKALGVPKELALDLGNKVTMKLVFIPAGRFLMGTRKEERPIPRYELLQHEVTISKPFYMGIYLVTRGQFAAFVNETGYKTDAEKQGWTYGGTGPDMKLKGASWQKPGFDQTDEHPVVCVSYNDAVAFCEWLSRKSGKAVTLPTEAQWEYACRAGTQTNYLWGDNPDDGKGWCNAADQTMKKTLVTKKDFKGYFNWDDGYTFTSPVGKFKENAFGLYDMNGNAQQWCADFYDEDYHAANGIDPQGPQGGWCRVLRGGCWDVGPIGCRSDFRTGLVSEFTGRDIGFRVVVLPDHK